MQKTNQEEFRIEKVIKKKESKLYVKWKRFDNSFNSWIDNGDNSYLFVNGKEMTKFKTKDSEIVANPLCLGSISKDFSEKKINKKLHDSFLIISQK